MLRRYIPKLLAPVLLALIAVQAMGSALNSDWQRWSKDGCEKLLTDSPWAHTWRGDYGLAYTVQVRSALPIREALVRQQQLLQHYDKMTGEQRISFDTWTGQMLDQDSKNTILVNVYMSRGNDNRAIVPNGEDLNASLVSDDGKQIRATKTEMNQLEKGFEATFPRSIDGAAVIQHGQKYFSVRFLDPETPIFDNVGIPTNRWPIKIPPQSVQVKFDLSKMLFNGELNY
jgi:hypothetical protein